MPEDFFRPQSETPARGVASNSEEADKPAARRAFREMSGRLMDTQNRRDPIEWFVAGLILALVAWPLVDLLIVLAQTANG